VPRVDAARLRPIGLQRSKDGTISGFCLITAITGLPEGVYIGISDRFLPIARPRVFLTPLGLPVIAGFSLYLLQYTPP